MPNLEEYDRPYNPDMDYLTINKPLSEKSQLENIASQITKKYGGDNETEYAGILYLLKGIKAKDLRFNIHLLKSLLMQYNHNTIRIYDKVLDKNTLIHLLLFIKKRKAAIGAFETLTMISVQGSSCTKHLVLCAIYKSIEEKKMNISLIEPLSRKDSIYKSELNLIKERIETLSLGVLNLIYSGLQDKNYGTCGDICLIMMQKVIELSLFEKNTLGCTINKLFVSNKINYKALGSISIFKPDKCRYSTNDSSLGAVYN